MSDAIIIALMGTVVNGAVTWGIISTKQAWLRKDLDELTRRVNIHMDRRDYATRPANL